MFKCPKKIRALEFALNQGLLILGRDILLEICSFIWYYVLQSFCINNKSWNMKNVGLGDAISFHIGPIFIGRQPLEYLKLGVWESVLK